LVNVQDDARFHLATLNIEQTSFQSGILLLTTGKYITIIAYFERKQRQV